MHHKILINSELPLCLLDENVNLNDIDFVLYHLYSSNPTYKAYYRKLRQSHPERIMILDNSAYEFYVSGQTLDMNGFVEAINELKPDMYLLPDTLMDAQKTIRATLDFLDYWIPRVNNFSQPMAVPQGTDPHEMIYCLNQYQNWGINRIALPFHNSFYKETPTIFLSLWAMKFNSYNEDTKYAAGRCEFIVQNRDLLKSFNYVHLLGSHHPWEKVVLETMVDFIVSMDTGYPVKVGYAGYKLFEEPKKPEIIIDQFLEEDLNPAIQKLICENVKEFSLL